MSAARKPKPEAITKAELKAEVAAWAKLMRVTPKEVHLRRMTRKWGSCSSAGRLTLAEDLLVQPTRGRKEVIVHELLHLKVPNHGKLFKSLLKAYLARQIVAEPGEEVFPPNGGWS
jgi:predicted metal-dependent hydrolase